MEIVIQKSQYKILLPIVNIASVDASGDDWVLTLFDGEQISVSGSQIADLEELLQHLSLFKPIPNCWVNVTKAGV
jgi:hypothetical protein